MAYLEYTFREKSRIVLQAQNCCMLSQQGMHGEQEEMAKKLQAEQEEARATQPTLESLKQQVFLERTGADKEQDARLRELEELTYVCGLSWIEKQQRGHDGEMRHEFKSQIISERDEKTR